ncbi:MAG: hypothetical protein LBF93_04965 [Zoogloeaceae bacterium]|jgi:prophage antirepressor-like protein|nr:hypothetical protein [Zoogloeaceae bacterium]
MSQLIPADFFGTQLSIIDHDGRRWLTAEQVGLALGFAPDNARKGVLKLYERHNDDFSVEDKGVVKLTTPGGKQDAVIFSGTCCITLGWLAGTPRAKYFKRWAKEHLAAQLENRPLPAPAPVRQDIAARQDIALAEEVGRLRDVLEAQGQTLLALHAQVASAQRGHIQALNRLIHVQAAPEVSAWEMKEADARLKAAVARDPRGKAGVAQRLGVSRPILARVLSPNDPTPLSRKLARRILGFLPRERSAS